MTSDDGDGDVVVVASCFGSGKMVVVVLLFVSCLRSGIVGTVVLLWPHILDQEQWW